MKEKSLFSNINCCKLCNMVLSESYEGDICPSCLEQELFHEVKDYIRENDVTEQQVAEHFELPIKKVRNWIREGRIEYKEMDGKLVGVHCIRCGAPIFSGTYCAGCNKLINGPLRVYKGNDNQDTDKMRFLNEEVQEK